MTFEDIGERLARFVLKHRAATLLVTVLSVGLFAAGATRATVSTDYRIFFSPDDPKLHAFEALEATFTRTDNILFVVRARRGDVFHPRVLGAIQAVTEGSWDLPHAARVDSLTNFQNSYSVDEDLVVEELVAGPAEELSAADLQRIRGAVESEPLVVGGLLADDSKSAGVNVILRLPREDPQEVADASDAARALAARVQERYPEVEVRVSGMALFNDAFMEASLEDMSWIVPLMYVAVLFALLALLRSVGATAAVVGVVGFASLTVLGVAGWLGYPITPPTAAAPTIVLTLAVADSVHLVVSWRHAMRDGHSRHEALVRALRTNFRPVFWTSTTTMIGFLCLNFAEAPPYWHLANMTSAGVAAAWIYSFTFLPAVLSFVQMKVPAAAAASDLRSWTVKLGDVVIRHRNFVLVGALALTGVSGVAALQLTTNDHFLEYFDDSIAFRPDTEFVLEHLTGVYQLEYQIDSGEENGVSDPRYLAELAEFSAWLRQQPEVEHVYSYSDIVSRLNRNMHGDEAAYRRVPESQELASQYLLLYEMSLPMGRDLNDRLDVDRSMSRLTVTVGNLSSRELQDFAARSSEWLRMNTPSVMHAEPISPVVIFSTLSDRNTRAMMGGNIADLILISFCMFFAFRSIRIGFLSLLPNLLPIVIGYGLWALMFREINVVASVAGAISLGIVVDDTIHFLSKYQLARREGLDAEAAVRATMEEAAPGMIATSLVILLGFGMLMFSGFQMNSYLGLLTVLIVGSALPADLLLMPALLVWVDGSKVGVRQFVRRWVGET